MRILYFFAAAATAGLGACSSPETTAGGLPPRPANVPEETRRACDHEARRAASETNLYMGDGPAVLFSLLTGQVGAIAAGAIADAAKSSAYSSAYDECVARELKTKKAATPLKTAEKS